jgi:transposase
MAKTVSVDLRMRIAAALARAEESHPLIAERFGVSVSTVEVVSRKLREGRSLEPAPRPGRTRALGDEHFRYLTKLLQNNAYITSHELAALYNQKFKNNRVHRSTVLRAMHDLGFSFKKKHTTRRRGIVQT